MKPLLVHLHLFYPEMWPNLKPYIQKLASYPFELYVTMVSEHPEIEKDARLLCEHVHFEVVENRGYDLGPFVSILNKINLSEYDYVIKLHTKRNVPLGMLFNAYDVGQDRWRKYAFSFMNHISECIDAFAQDSKLGMVADYRLITYKEKDDLTAVTESKKFLRQLKLPTDNDFAYVAGTMFICRAALLQPLKDLGLTLNRFSIPERSQKSTLAHTLERFVGWAVKAQGYEIKDCFTPKVEQMLAQILAPFRYLRNFIYRKKITKKGKVIIKICKIPIWHCQDHQPILSPCSEASALTSCRCGNKDGIYQQQKMKRKIEK